MASSNCVVGEGGGTALLLKKLPNDRFPFPVVDGPASAAPWGMGSVVLTWALRDKSHQNFSVWCDLEQFGIF